MISMGKWSNPHSNSKYSGRQAWAIGVDQEQTAQNAASDQDLHYLQLNQAILNAYTGSKMDLLKRNIR